jgi:urea transporter
LVFSQLVSELDEAVFAEPIRPLSPAGAICANATVFIGGLTRVMFAPMGLPIGTLPFCFSSLAFALLQVWNTGILSHLLHLSHQSPQRGRNL